MIEIISISDLHIEGNDRDKPSEAEIDFVEKNYPGAYLLGTGDMSDDGGIAQSFKLSRILRDRWINRKFFAPGNHDKGLAGNFYDKRRSKRFDSMLKSLGIKDKFHGKFNRPAVHFIEDGISKVMLILLDSCLETKHFFDFASGKIGAIQRFYLNRLVNNPKYIYHKKIVALHHHPFIRNDFTMCLWDSNKFMDIIAGKIDVLIFGHRHKFERCVKQEREYKIPFILANGSPKKGERAEDSRLWRISIGEDESIKTDSISMF